VTPDACAPFATQIAALHPMSSALAERLPSESGRTRLGRFRSQSGLAIRSARWIRQELRRAWGNVMAISYAIAEASDKFPELLRQRVPGLTDVVAGPQP